MTQISLQNPVFCTYLIAASLMILKMAGQAWMTVYRMTKVKGGYRSPEDVKRSPFNPQPSADQTMPNEYVERSRRIHQNDGENIPLFLVVGFLLVVVAPPLWIAQVVFYGYAATRILHTIAYATAQLHDVRAMLWTPGSLLIIGTAGYLLVRAVGY